MGKTPQFLDLDIDLSDKQKSVYNTLCSDKYGEFLFYGAARSGKTFLVLYWLIVQCLAYKVNCLVVRAFMTALEAGMIRQTMPEVLDAIAVHNGYTSYSQIIMSNGKRFASYAKTNKVLTFYNGNYIQFGALKSSGDSSVQFDRILSTQWAHIFADEVSEIEEAAINHLRTRLATKMDVKGVMIMALNPTFKSSWVFRRFFKFETPEGLKLAKKITQSFCVVHFTQHDNAENIASGFYDNISASGSAFTIQRFREGIFQDEIEGEVFSKITWGNEGEWPRSEDFEDIIVYTDPSAGESRNNDYKASVLIGKALNKFWLIDVRAVQGSSLAMMQNIYELWNNSPNQYITKIVMEKKQVPLDFKLTFEQFQSQVGWICPLQFDTRNMGDKFTVIESILSPLFAQGKFIFHPKLKNTPDGELAVRQTLEFSRKKSTDTRKDDIPDACARGVSLLNRGVMGIGNLMGDMPKIIKPKRKSLF